MDQAPLVQLTSIAVAGISSQWLAWRIRIPSILLLIFAGIALGPLSVLFIPGGFLQPDLLFGSILQPLVALAVAVILFEGGLTLKLKELREMGGELLALVTVGALVTWIGVSVLAWTVLGFSLPLSILLGSILVVTGPTVVTPLLRHLRLGGRSGSLLKWEGIVIDPIGATLAVLVFEAIGPERVGSVAGIAVEAIVITLLVGGVLGVGGGVIFSQLLRRFWIPEYLKNAVVLMAVLGLFTISNLLQHEAGLLTVTVFGIYLANQKHVPIRSILEFKENLQVLLLSAVFITLSARLRIEDILSVDLRIVGFVAALILLLRPLAVFVSTFRSKISFQEKVLLASLAPRGIVAAAIASIFAAQLSAAGIEGAEKLVPVTFMVIIGTVMFYSLVTPPLARMLGLTAQSPNGILIVGAQRWAREIAEVLRAHGADVLLVDTNWHNVTQARQQGFQCHYGSVLSDELHESLEMTQFSKLLALTQNDEANSLAADSFAHVLGRVGVFQLPPELDRSVGNRDLPSRENLKGRLLFDSDATYSSIAIRFAEGAIVHATKLTEEFGLDEYREQHPDALNLFVQNSDGAILPVTVEASDVPGKDVTLFALSKDAEASV